MNKLLELERLSKQEEDVLEVRYTVPVANAMAPTIAIGSSASNTLVPRKASITITATPVDNVGVTKVEFAEHMYIFLWFAQICSRFEHDGEVSA